MDNGFENYFWQQIKFDVIFVGVSIVAIMMFFLYRFFIRKTTR